MSDWNAKIIAEFRANDGKVGGPFENTPLLLLHTTGAKSGKERVNPVAYFREGENLVIVASKGGAPNNPGWYHNLVSNPKVVVEVGTEQFQARAEPADEPARTELYAKMVSINPGFGEYQRKTDRAIPVVILTPQS